MATCLTEVKALIESGEHDFFVATIDYALPDANDGEAIPYILSHKIPSVVMTGKMDEETRQKIWSKAVIDYIPKENSHAFIYLKRILAWQLTNHTSGVLVVDDSRSTRNHVAELLRRRNFNVYIAEHGKEALEVLKENKDIKKGVKYLEKVAKNNYKDANYLLGTLFLNDKFFAKNLEKADLYLAKAYKQKDKKLPELLESIDESLKKQSNEFPKLMAAMKKKPLVRDKNNNLSWSKGQMEIITINSAPLTTLFDEQLVTFKRRKKTTGSKLQGKTCDEQVGCYQAKLGRMSIDTFFNITSASSYSN